MSFGFDNVVERLERVKRKTRDNRFLGFNAEEVPIDQALQSEIETVRSSENEGYGNCVGAADLEYDSENDRVISYYRKRNPEERGHTGVISSADVGTLDFEDEWSITKQDLEADSVEGGALNYSDDEVEFFVSYKPKGGEIIGDGWRTKRFTGDDVQSLEPEGDIDIESEFYHFKDPVIDPQQNLNFNSNSRFWTKSVIESIDGTNGENPDVQNSVSSNEKIRATGFYEDDILIDRKPNNLWNCSERTSIISERDGLGAGVLVSPEGGAVRYLALEEVGDGYYGLWEQEAQDGSHNLKGTILDPQELNELTQALK